MALQRDPVFVKEFIDEFQDRFCYARDYFDTRHQEFIKTLDLPQSILEKIYHGNAERLLAEYK